MHLPGFLFEGTNGKYYFFFQKYIYLGKITFIYCSRITVAHVDVNIFVKNHFNFFQFVLTGWT